VGVEKKKKRAKKNRGGGTLTKSGEKKKKGVQAQTENPALKNLTEVKEIPRISSRGRARELRIMKNY